MSAEQVIEAIKALSLEDRSRVLIYLMATQRGGHITSKSKRSAKRKEPSRVAKGGD